MSELSTAPPAEATSDFWVGWLASAIVGALHEFDQERPGDAEQALRRTASELLSSSACGDELHELLAGRLHGGYAVLASNGEAYALRPTLITAYDALMQANTYLDGARTSGHPRSHAWVEERMPLKVQRVTLLERESILDDGTPVLDREP